MIEMEFAWEGTDLSTLNERIKAALAAKLIELTQLLYEKVEANVTGKILQKRTGALLEKISEGTEIDTASNPMTSFVGPKNPGPKEWALEKGGKGYYGYGPKKAHFLRWISKEGIHHQAKWVNHPPSKEFGYLSEAAKEMETLVPEGFAEAVNSVLGGGI